jgi:hypothetical protein
MNYLQLDLVLSLLFINISDIFSLKGTQMSKHEKLVKRFLNCPTDFTWDELTTLLKGIGYMPVKTRKTGGSRVRFDHQDAGAIILHRPHPTPILKQYQINQIIDILKRGNMI